MADDEDAQLQAVTLENARAILRARQRAEQELVRAKEALEERTRELAHSLAMMRATLDSTTDGILVTDARGRVSDVNAKYVAMWRLTPEVVESREHARVVDAIAAQTEAPAQVAARIAEIEAASPEETFDVLELADGRLFERFSRRQVVGGLTVGRVWSVRDVTDRRRSEEVLREETRLLELLNRTGQILSSELELEPLLQALTDATTELSGAAFGAFYYNATDAGGDGFRLSALSGAKREDFERFGQPRATPLFAPIFRGQGAIRCDDVRTDPRYGQMAPHHGTPSGHTPVRSYLAVPVVSRAGTVLGGLFFGHPRRGVFTERTERLMAGVAAQAAVAIDNARLYQVAQAAAEDRKQLLENEQSARGAAERASAMKDEFLATLSHELRTPLTAILGWAKILQRPGVSDADRRRGLEVIDRNTSAQVQLIEDLLDMSRITSGRLHLDIRPVVPSAFIEAAMETVRPAAEARGIEMTAWLEPGAGPVAGDPNRLQQVVWNLLANAIKFTGQGGRVHVRLRRIERAVEMSVADTGIGMAPDFLPHVFDRFRQADGTTTRNVGGLGLGLAIVKQLVELHGGSVRAESPGPGRGATFTVELPLPPLLTDGSDWLARQLAAPALDFKQLNLAGITVLVVDDDADSCELLERTLAGCHATVLTARSAEEALPIVERARPHVLVSDIGMPDVDGYELLRRVRGLGLARGGGVPAVALTAFARTEDRTRALRAGFLAHVPKPVEPLELVATVASVVGRTGEPARE